MLIGHFVAAWKLALRSKSFQAVFVLALLLLGIAYLGAAFSARQPRVVALDLGLSGIRLGLLLLNLFWIHELFSKEIERRSILLYLSFPVPRSIFVTGRFLAIQVISFLAASLLAVVLFYGVRFASWGHEAGSSPFLSIAYVASVIAIWFEVMIVATFTLAVALISTTLFFPMLMGFLFALAGRMIGPVIDYLLSGADGNQALVDGFIPVLSRIRWALPDLSLLDIRAWALYDSSPDILSIMTGVFSCGAYGVLAFIVALKFFERRTFV